MDIVPTWDGNTESLARWILRLNDIAKKSPVVRQQLGMVIPQRLTGDAERWYYALPTEQREHCELDWENIRDAIGAFYMNRTWVEKTRKLAMAIRYREPGHSRETPSQYFIRKRELLQLVFDNSENELITDIMAGAPLAWRTILTPRLYATAADLQNAIKIHEDDLLELEIALAPRVSSSNYREPRFSGSGTTSAPYRARSNLVGWSKSLPPPKFPKDDSNVSRKATPESKGARPCRHCGSGKHWDYECKHARQGTKFARANLATHETDDSDAQEAYDALYYDELTDSEMDENLREEGDVFEARSQAVHTAHTYTVSAHHPCRIQPQSLRQRLAQVLLAKSATPSPGTTHDSEIPNNLVELTRPMARPPGCSFLGSRATTVSARLQQLNASPTSVIIDSGSDITLISQKALSTLSDAPRPRIGQKVKLIQVTGNTTISGYVPLTLFFDTEAGPVKIKVEAYVVKGMSAPLILGNDFTEQYSISLLRQGGRLVYSSEIQAVPSQQWMLWLMTSKTKTDTHSKYV